MYLGQPKLRKSSVLLPFGWCLFEFEANGPLFECRGIMSVRQNHRVDENVTLQSPVPSRSPFGSLHGREELVTSSSFESCLLFQKHNSSVRPSSRKLGGCHRSSNSTVHRASLRNLNQLPIRTACRAEGGFHFHRIGTLRSGMCV